MSFCLVETSWSLSRFLVIAHMVSIVARSGEFPGQGKTRIPFDSKCLEDFLLVCHGALSCCSIPSPFGNFSTSSGMILVLMTCTYWSEFIIPSQTCKHPVPAAEKHPQNMTFAGCLTFWFKCPGDKGSLCARPVNLLWDPCTIKWLSSVNKTFLHRSTVHERCCLAHDNLFFFNCDVSNCFLTGRLEILPFLKSTLLTVLVLTSKPKLTLCWFEVINGRRWFSESSIRSSLLVSFFFLPHLFFRVGDVQPFFCVAGNDAANRRRVDPNFVCNTSLGHRRELVQSDNLAALARRYVHP